MYMSIYSIGDDLRLRKFYLYVYIIPSSSLIILYVKRQKSYVRNFKRFIFKLKRCFNGDNTEIGKVSKEQRENKRKKNKESGEE